MRHYPFPNSRVWSSAPLPLVLARAGRPRSRERRGNATWMFLTETGRSPGTRTAGTQWMTWRVNRTLAGSAFSGSAGGGCPKIGSEGPAVQADSTWYSERRVVRPTGIVADLTVPSSRPQSRARPIYGPALNRLRRLCDDCRTSEIELMPSDPDPVHDHGKLVSRGDGGALIRRHLATEIRQARRRDHLPVRVISADAAS